MSAYSGVLFSLKKDGNPDVMQVNFGDIMVSKISQSSRDNATWFPGGSDAYNVGDPGSIPGLERSPGEGNDNTL